MRLLRACLASLVAACILAGSAPAAGLLDSPWPAFRHDSAHTGASALLGPPDGVLLLEYPLGGISASSPAVGNGVIYAVGGGHLSAVTTAGVDLWSYPLVGTGKSSPAIAADGVIYVASTDSWLYALNPDGTLRWKKSLPGPTDASPTVAADGTVYIGCSTGAFQAYRATGMSKFAYTAGGAIASSAAVAADGTIYFGCDDGKLYALKADGTLKWKYSTSPASAVKSSPAVASDGTVYFGTVGGNLYAVTSAGTLRWRFAAGGAIHSSPAVAPDGTLFFGARDNYIYAVTKTGALKWKYHTGGYVDSSPAVDGAGTVYIGSNDGLLYALRPDGSLAWLSAADGAITSSPAVGDMGAVYVTTQAGSLCVFGSVAPPPAPIVFDDGVYTTSTDTLHAEWTCGDPYGSITAYEYAIGTAQGAEDVVGFTRIGAVNEITCTGLPLVNGARYYFSVRAVNGANQVGEAGFSDGITVDFTPPVVPVVIDDGDFTANDHSLHAVYSSGDTESGIQSYDYSVGTAPQAVNVMGWRSAGSVKDLTIDGLSLVSGAIYYVNVRANNHAGLASVGSSNGITVDLTPPQVTSVMVHGALTELRVTVNASDPESGIAARQYVVLSEPVLPDAPVWLVGSASGPLIIPGEFDPTKNYYVAVRVINGAGAVSAPKISGRVVFDITPPTQPIVIDDGEYTYSPDCLHATYSASDEQSGIDGCQYCVGTSPGAADVLPWTGGSPNGSISATGFTLVPGARYFISVKVRNGAGLWSAPGTSDGIEFRPGVSVWPKFRCDSANNGRSGVHGPATSRLHWRVQTQGYIESSAAIAGDGTSYIGSGDGKLYAINPAGTVRWSYQTGGCIDSSPTIGPNGLIYVGSYDGGLYCVNPNGSLQWKYTAGGMIWSSPNVDASGIVYFGCQDGYIYALNPDGTRKWRYYAGGAIWSSPAIGSNGVIYFGSGSGRLYALNSSGVLQWKYQTGSAMDSSPAVSDGVIYFGSGDGNFYALNTDGTLKWRATVGRPVDSSPAGVELWRLNVTGGVRSSPAVAGDGTIYVGSANGIMYAVRPDGTIRWSYSTGHSILGSPAFAPDGSLVVGCDDGGVYCFRDRPAADTTPPTVPEVRVAHNFISPTQPLSAWWSSTDAESGIESYSYAIGTGPGMDNIVAWTNIGLATNVTRGDCPFVQGATYYISVRATNNALLTSGVGVSQGMVYLPGEASTSIGVAKKQPIGTQVTLPGKIVAAVFSDSFMIEEPDRSAGIRCMLASAPVQALAGVNVTGKVGRLNDEVVITDVSVTRIAAAVSIDPLFVTTRAVAAIGVDLKGMMVRLAGRVTGKGQGFFALSDGARMFTSLGWPGLEVKTLTDSAPAVGSFVSVTGVPCREVRDGIPFTILRATEEPMALQAEQ